MKFLLISILLFVFSCDDDPVSPIHGCLDSQACNYNPNASIDNNSCELPEENFDCDGLASIIGTWNKLYDARGYYTNDNPSICVSVEYDYDEFTQHDEFDINGYWHIQISETEYGIHFLYEFPTVEENMCDINLLMIGLNVSFQDNICKYEETWVLPMNGNITSNSISYPFDGDEHPMLNYKLNENNLEIINSMGGNVICVYNNEIHHYWGENNNESECVEIGGIFTTDCNTDYYIRMNDSEF